MPMTDADRKAEEALDLRRVTETDFGRRVIWRLIQRAGLNDSVTREVDRPMDLESRVMYNAGQQDIAHWLNRKVQMANPDGWKLMHAEAEARFLKERQNGG